MNILGASWRTTMSGILTILAVIGHVAEALLNGKPIDWTITIAGITSGIGLLTARDNKVSSEAVGANTNVAPPK
jgi:hypothetical protein